MMTLIDADVKAALAEGAEKDILRDAMNNVDANERGLIVVPGNDEQILFHRESIRGVFHQIQQTRNDFGHQRTSLEEKRERLKRSFNELENDLIREIDLVESRKATELTRMSKVAEAHQAAIAVLEGKMSLKKPNPAS